MGGVPQGYSMKICNGFGSSITEIFVKSGSPDISLNIMLEIIKKEVALLQKFEADPLKEFYLHYIFSILCMYKEKNVLSHVLQIWFQTKLLTSLISSPQRNLKKLNISNFYITKLQYLETL